MTAYQPRRPTIEIVDRQMAAILREKTEAERLQIAWGMWHFAREMIENTLRAERVDWSNAEIQHETARRLSNGSW
ncbi:MAG: hypothetical protein EXS16_19130 [Gemmataceae bacterium]|nr:hypothetical protein [Gemmataceae bacterium]